ncbi:MAG TPA: hypothetical protein VNU66_03455 [Mycobacteriales bacterium]|nr:hypothetical protein [Mycobacteriales bacterium]
MTQIIDRPSTAEQRYTVRSALELARLQLDALAAFTRARREAEDAADGMTSSREDRMDRDRRLEVVQRQHAALVERLDAQLAASGRPLQEELRPRAVVVHRDEWFTAKVCPLLEGQGWEVVARVDNGADAVGIAVAEQPDLLLTGEKLLMLPGEEVVQAVRRYCSSTVVAVQVGHGDQVAELLDVGAHVVVTRQVPPADLVADLTAPARFAG